RTGIVCCFARSLLGKWTAAENDRSEAHVEERVAWVFGCRLLRAPHAAAAVSRIRRLVSRSRSATHIGSKPRRTDRADATRPAAPPRAAPGRLHGASSARSTVRRLTRARRESRILDARAGDEARAEGGTRAHALLLADDRACNPVWPVRRVHHR